MKLLALWLLAVNVAAFVLFGLDKWFAVRHMWRISERTLFAVALLGASPRAALALMRVSQSYAAVCGRDYVTPEDVKRMAVPVLAHRLILRTAFGQGGRGEAAVQEVLDAVRVPTEPDEE